jgi:hypothetical protein
VEPVDRRALLLQLLGLVVVDRERQRDLARDHELGEGACGPLRTETPLAFTMSRKTLAALASPISVNWPASQSASFLLDAELALPLGVGELLPGLGHLLLLHQLGVVRLHEDVEARAHPLAVRADRLLDQVLKGAAT